jgi:hypothetical protein
VLAEKLVDKMVARMVGSKAVQKVLNWADQLVAESVG